MNFKNSILNSRSRVEAQAHFANAIAHPHISRKNLRRCQTAIRSVLPRFPEAQPVVVTPKPVSKTKAVRKPRAKKVAVAATN